MSRPPLRNALSGLLVLHTLYTLYTLIIDHPSNLFKTLHIPLTTPAEQIRTVLLAHAGRTPGQPGAVLPPALESLLTRLASFDMRQIYVRFGQHALQSCTYCRSDEDFALHFLPPTLLQYVRTAALLGTLTLRGSGRASRRVLSVGMFAVAAALEVYWLLTVRIDVPRNGRGVIYWHDTCWTLRHILFLLLPLAVHLLPLRAFPPPPGVAALQALPLSLGTLGAALERWNSVKIAQAAVAREPELSARAEQWWAREVAEGKAGREDAGVKRVAEKTGIREEKLREDVRPYLDKLVEVLWMRKEE